MARDAIPGSAEVRTAPGVLSTELASEIIMLNLDAGVYYGLEDVGAEIWKHIAKGATVDEIVAAVVAVYDVDEPRCRRDVNHLLTDLAGSGLVQIRRQR